MDGILDGLNEAQKAAVCSPASVLQVLAPPGSGKTKTLTARAAYLIAHQGIPPSAIIVCTFTVKAAREMRDRIEKALGPDIANKLILGTFHSICRRLLSRHGDRIGLDQKFGIADTADSKSIISKIIKQNDLSIDKGKARGRISRLKANRITAEQHATSTRAKNHGATSVDEELTILYAAYEEHLKLSNLLDYDDLLMRCADLLHTSPACVSRIEAVLIDEFQDTNHVQYDLMRLFSQYKNVISIVGDPDQSIYGWRSAEIENLQKMKNHYPETHVATLEENYRSAASILFAAQEVIEQDNERPQKSLAPTHSVGLPPTLRQLCCADAEALWIANEIQRICGLTGGLLNWNDFAILMRSASLSRLIEAALSKAGIPHRVVGGTRVFDRYEVRLVLDYLRVLDRPNHDEALLRVLNNPPRLIGAKTVKLLVEEAYDKKTCVWDLVLRVSRGSSHVIKDISSQAQKGIGAFVKIIVTSRNKLASSDGTRLESFVRTFVEKIGLRDHLKQKYSDQEEHTQRWSNVQELIAQSGDVEAAASKDLENLDEHLHDKEICLSLAETLPHFLANIALSTSLEEHSNADAPQKGQITLSTMHAAKGLEWPVVFIPAAYAGNIPHSRAENVDEERRILYVAMTRAQALLYLSYPLQDSMRNKTALSSFLLTDKVFSHLAHQGATMRCDNVQEIAIVLRRHIPSVENIENGRKSVHNVADDQFDSGPDVADEDSHRGHDRNCPRRERLPKCSSSHNGKRGSEEDANGVRPSKTSVREVGSVSHHTTMSMPQMLSTAELSCTKFVSARDIVRHESETETSLQNVANRASCTIKDKTIPAKQSKPLSKQSPSQSSLTGFLTKRTTTQDQLGDTRSGQRVAQKKTFLESPLEDISNSVVECASAGTSKKKFIRPAAAEVFKKPYLTPKDTQDNPSSHLQRKHGARPQMNGWDKRMERERSGGKASLTRKPL